MNLNQYKLRKRTKGMGKLSWDLLIWFSKLTLFSFFLITAITFWQDMSIRFVGDYQINLSKQIGEMILIVLITIILIGIDMLKNLKIRK